jgi:restriction system protein
VGAAVVTDDPRFPGTLGQTRRTGTVNALIRSDMADKGLTTRPPFTEGRVEDEIEIIPVDTTS